jgi:hypothetical protein
MSSKTNRIKFLNSVGLPDNVSLSIEDISALSGIPTEALQISYNRGISAWKNNPQSIRLKTTFGKVPSAPRKSKIGKEQWAMGRVFAFVQKTPKVYYGSDNDIREKFGLD